MALLWFFAGMSTALALMALSYPWLRTQSYLTRLIAAKSTAAGAAAVLMTAILCGYALSGPSRASMPDAVPGSFAAAAKILGNATGEPASNNAGSMDAAVANLEARLTKGGGTPGDWELLAKSFEFLGRPAAAAEARAHRLPPLTGTHPMSGGPSP